MDLNPASAAGILTQSAFLATHGHEGSAPIFRGIAVREQLFCVELPPPPPGADNLFPPPSATKTTRERLQKHRVNPECASCHDLMDTLGYGFESFDDIGRYRTTENSVTIDDTRQDHRHRHATARSRVRSSWAAGWRRARPVQQCVTTQWFRYAMGRTETTLDKCTLDIVFQRFQESEFRLPELLLGAGRERWVPHPPRRGGPNEARTDDDPTFSVSRVPRSVAWPPGSRRCSPSSSARYRRPRRPGEPPKRLLLVYWSGGTAFGNYLPTGTETNWQLSSQMKSLEPYKKR